MRFPRVRWIVPFAVGTVTGLLGHPARGQDSVSAESTVRSVQGHVTVQRTLGPAPVPGSWVTLHRVAGDSAGPLDSVRTNAAGEYSLRYRTFGSSDAIYFVSTRFGGVAYFTSPLRGVNVRGEGASLDVFDTTTAPVPTTVRGRHLIVGAPDASGTREIIEVYELSNDSSVTRLDRESTGEGSWSTLLPTRAAGFRVRDGEIPPDALVRSGDQVVLRMPFAPGLKQVAFSYTLPTDAFPLGISAVRGASVLEVLIEENGAQVRGGKLTAVQPVVVEGRSFRRFLAQDVAAGSTITIDAPRPEPSWTRWIVPGILGVLGLGMVSVLALPRKRRGRQPAPAAGRGVVAPSSDPSIDPAAAALAQRIAALDDAFDREPAPTTDARDAYERSRAALKSELADALSTGAGRADR